MGAIVAAGMMGGLALLLAQLTKQQMATQKKAETGVEIVSISQRILRALYDGSACLNTLGAGTPIAAGTISINSIRNKNNQALFTVGQTYRNRLIRIASINLQVSSAGGGQAEAVLQVEMSRESSAYTGQKSVTKPFPLTLELDTNGNLISCIPESGMEEPVVQSMCSVYGGPSAWDREKCNLGICSGADFMKGFWPSSGGMCAKPGIGTPCPPGQTCPPTSTNCPDGQAVTSFAGGAPRCSPLSCGTLTDAEVKAGLGGFTGNYIVPVTSCADETAFSIEINCFTQHKMYIKYTPLGCCYAGGEIITTTDSSCPATNPPPPPPGGRALRMEYCKKETVQCGPLNTSSRATMNAITRLDCRWCDDKHLRVNSWQFISWGCDPPVSTDRGGLTVETFNNCAIPKYDVSGAGPDGRSICVLEYLDPDMSIYEVNDNKLLVEKDPTNDGDGSGYLNDHMKGQRDYAKKTIVQVRSYSAASRVPETGNRPASFNPPYYCEPYREVDEPPPATPP